MPFKRHTRHDRVLLEDVCRTIDNTTASVDGVMEAPRLVCAFLESWDARQGGIRVKTEDELSMPAEKPGYASDMPAPQLVFFLEFLESSKDISSGVIVEAGTDGGR